MQNCMTPTELQDSLKKFAYRVVKVTESIPDSILSKVIKGQILRSAFSGAANYRSACTGYTKKMFNSKLAIALEEVDEPVFCTPL
ncbi:four helix bundle protein [Niastella caeni]|uniref:Four helix bundle protein n=2 Tax=Niastella caeni TaxID=2569763 RepID=A0A4S8HG17_9BACT|nr:four helix bundle protein [Niastella caeni]